MRLETPLDGLRQISLARLGSKLHFGYGGITMANLAPENAVTASTRPALLEPCCLLSMYYGPTSSFNISCPAILRSVFSMICVLLPSVAVFLMAAASSSTLIDLVKPDSMLETVFPFDNTSPGRQMNVWSRSECLEPRSTSPFSVSPYQFPSVQCINNNGKLR
jgi:hypothetical protein